MLIIIPPLLQFWRCVDQLWLYHYIIITSLIRILHRLILTYILCGLSFLIWWGRKESLLSSGKQLWMVQFVVLLLHLICIYIFLELLSSSHERKYLIFKLIELLLPSMAIPEVSSCCPVCVHVLCNVITGCCSVYAKRLKMSQKQFVWYRQLPPQGSQAFGN